MDIRKWGDWYGGYFEWSCVMVGFICLIWGIVATVRYLIKYWPF